MGYLSCLLRPLTIERWRFGDLWIPSFRDQIDAVREMRRVVEAAYDDAYEIWHDEDMKDAKRRRARALSLAESYVGDEARSTVRHIRDMGGLLLLTLAEDEE